MTAAQPAAPAMTDEEIAAAVIAYDEARRASHGPNEQAMSDRNRQTIAPMIRAAVETVLVPRLTAEIAARKEAEDRAQAWHGMCQAIATILGLPEPELGFPAIVRAYDEEQRARAVAAEARVAELVAVLKPFADACQQTTEMDHAGKLVAIVIVVGHLRRARTALGGSQ